MEELRRLGGCATRGELIVVSSRAAVDRALREGAVLAVGRGQYVLPDVEEAARTAHAVCGVLCLTSAAVHHGWPVKLPPPRPHVALARGRTAPGGVVVHRYSLHPDQVDGVATSRVTTLEMCLRLLPFDEALTVADSYLRLGGLPATLRGIAASARGPGSRQMRRIAGEATPDAANPFESVLRAIALDVPGLHVRSQVVISSSRVQARPDLVDEDLGVVLEADSFAWHGDRAALRRDAVRHNLLVADGWIVLRFSWEEVTGWGVLLEDVVRRYTELAPGPRPAACDRDRRRRSVYPATSP